MSVLTVNQSCDSVTLEVKIDFNRSMLDSEQAIQQALNEAGTVATEKLLKTFDTDGSPLVLGSVKMTSMGENLKHIRRLMGKHK